jgi:hypothetical protein
MQRPFRTCADGFAFLTMFPGSPVVVMVIDEATAWRVSDRGIWMTRSTARRIGADW